jgi:hypothetical protein
VGRFTPVENAPVEWTRALSSKSILSDLATTKPLGIVKGQPLAWAKTWKAAGKELPYGFSGYEPKYVLTIAAK